MDTLKVVVHCVDPLDGSLHVAQYRSVEDLLNSLAQFDSRQSLAERLAQQLQAGVVESCEYLPPYTNTEKGGRPPFAQ